MESSPGKTAVTISRGRILNPDTDHQQAPTAGGRGVGREPHVLTPSALGWESCQGSRQPQTTSAPRPVPRGTRGARGITETGRRLAEISRRRTLARSATRPGGLEL